MFFIKNIKLDIYIKNNEEEFNYKDIPCTYKDNHYIFSIEEDNYDIDINDFIVFHKKNIKSEIDFVFKNNSITKGSYFIKELNFYMDANVKTKKYIVNDNNIDIEYKLWLQDEEIGNFIFKIKVKE